MKVYFIKTQVMSDFKAKMHVDSFVDGCLRQLSHLRSAAEHFSALEWFLALDEFCEMPEAWHPTHDSQVD